MPPSKDAVMFKTIVVPVDGSETSRNAVEAAMAMARAFGSVVQLISVIDDYAFTGVGLDFAYGQAEYLTSAKTEAELCLKAARERFESCGIEASTSIIEGKAIYKAILETASAMGADLVVMGSHGRKGVEKLVLGSVAAQVLSHAHLPVLVIRD
jgi:nucleotide-binding universal stress UspA family protein